MKKIGWAVGIAVLMAGVAQAATIDWDGGGADTEWNTTNNWNVAYLPGATVTDSARFTAGDIATVNSAVTSPFAVKVLVRNGADLTVKADMDSLSAIEIADSSSADGTESKINQTAVSTVTVSGDVQIGGVDTGATGIYNQTAGTLDAGSITVKTNGTFRAYGANKNKTVTTATMTIQDSGIAKFEGEKLTVNATALNVGVTGAGTVNQTGVGTAVTSAGLNVGAGGAYNLDAGTLTTTADPTIDGTLTIDGGTFTMTETDAHTKILGSGLIELKSGKFDDDADATKANAIEAKVAISGGEVDWGRSVRLDGGELKVIGDDATISIDMINDGRQGDWVFEFDVDGISTITSATYLELGGANGGSSLEVLVGTYTGGTGDFVLFDASAGSFNTVSTDLDVSSWQTAYTGTYIEQNQTTGLVTLHVIPEPAALGLVVAFGGGMLFIRRLIQM